MIDPWTIVKLFAVLAGIAACVYEIATRPDLVEPDEREMHEWIRRQSRANPTVRDLEAREAGGPVVETYYDVLSRMSRAKETLN